MGSDIIRQITSSQMPLRIAGFAALTLCLIPGLPKLPFVLAGGLMLLASSRVRPRVDAAEAEAAQAALALRREHETPRTSPRRSRSTRSPSSLSADLIDLVDPHERRRPARTGSRRCAARSPSTSAS